MRLAIFSLFFIFSTINAAQNLEIDTLLQKINSSSNIEEKQQLLEELKKKLAYKNKKEKEQADAIIKAKQIIPSKLYDDTFLNK